MVNWWFGYLGSLDERDCYLGVLVALESQTTNLPLVDNIKERFDSPVGKWKFSIAWIFWGLQR